MSTPKKIWRLTDGGIYQDGLGYVALKMSRGANPSWDAEQDEAQALILAAPDMLKALLRCEQLANVAIHLTPTGALRNRLTEANILRYIAIAKAKSFSDSGCHAHLSTR